MSLSDLQEIDLPPIPRKRRAKEPDAFTTRPGGYPWRSFAISCFRYYFSHQSADPDGMNPVRRADWASARDTLAESPPVVSFFFKVMQQGYPFDEAADLSGKPFHMSKAVVLRAVTDASRLFAVKRGLLWAGSAEGGDANGDSIPPGQACDSAACEPLPPHGGTKPC